MAELHYDPEELAEYQNFVYERHEVWLARQAGGPQPWSADPIVRFHKFTNVFRVLDPGSQYALALGNELGSTELDVLARVFLYRYTNLPATWEHLSALLDGWPTAEDIIKPKRRARVLAAVDAYRAAGNQVFSGAYMILPQPGKSGDKVEQALDLTARVLTETGKAFLKAKAPKAKYDTLRQHYGVGEFMAMQILTDWGYSQYGEDRENEFVIAGPGSKKGTRWLSEAKAEAVIADQREWWLSQQVYLTGPNGRRRYPSLMDVQNTFCEYSKYARYRSRGGLLEEREYTPAHPGPQPAPVYPPAWGMS